MLLDTNESPNASLIITRYASVLFDTSDAAGTNFKSYHPHQYCHVLLTLRKLNGTF